MRPFDELTNRGQKIVILISKSLTACILNEIHKTTNIL